MKNKNKITTSIRKYIQGMPKDRLQPLIFDRGHCYKHFCIENQGRNTLTGINPGINAGVSFQDEQGFPFITLK